MDTPISNFPLCWPASWKRTKGSDRIWDRFSKGERQYNNEGKPTWVRYRELSVADAIQRILEEVSRLGVVVPGDIVISTNIPTRLDGLPYSNHKSPADPGVAIYWRTRKDKQTKCMAIDRYHTVAGNLAAVAASIAALRTVERHGGAEILERAFLGFQSLPPPINGGKPWWEVLEFENDRVAREDIEQRYGFLANRYHPDHGGSHDKMAELNEAIRQAREETHVQKAYTAG